MRLVQDHSNGAYGVQVRCITCGNWFWLSDGVSDLDGEAYKAYYCGDHIPQGQQVAKCQREHCTRVTCNPVMEAQS